MGPNRPAKVDTGPTNTAWPSTTERRKNNNITMSASAAAFDSDPVDPSAPVTSTTVAPAPAPSTSSAVATSVSPTAVATAPIPSLRIQRIADTPSDFLFTIEQPDTPDAALPVFFIDVLDISGSMGCPASDNTTSDAAAFSRADLVRHSVATQIELLRPQDSLAVVLFDHNSQVALPRTQDRAAARAILPRITPNGGTNIWGGLFKALQIAEEHATSVAGLKGAPQNVVILLQTDGESDATYNPPRGIVPTLMAWLDTHPSIRLTIHTIGYGMGDGLDTPLLRSIADATGGTTNYIPDGGMVGTVFIHLMANLMSIVHPDLTLQIPEAGYAQNVGPLQCDQVKELVVSLPGLTASDFSATLRTPERTLATATFAAATADTVPVGFPSAVHATLRTLRLALASPVLPNPLTDLIATVHAILPTDASHQMMSLLTDLTDSDPSRGQIGKAFASAAAYRRWGRHYIPTVISSLQNGWAINFKDTLSTEVFGTTLTHELVSRGDAIFMAIPPPTPSVPSPAAYGSCLTAAHRAPISMATVHSSAGPCFLPGSLVRMADGTEKRCDQIQPGDRDIAGYRIQCVIKTLVPTANIVRLSGPFRPVNAAPIPDDAGFTLWHPVLPEGGDWSHPATIGNAVERVETDAIYNFVLAPEVGEVERPGMLIVNGLKTCTMGHNYRANAVIDHPYFGARLPGVRNILDDLEQQPGWEHGYITWSNLQVEHDPVTGMICGMAPVPQAI